MILLELMICNFYVNIHLFILNVTFYGSIFDKYITLIYLCMCVYVLQGGKLLSVSYSTEILRGSCPISEFIDSYVDEPELTKYCKVCTNFKKRWSCSPHSFSSCDYLRQFSDIRLIGLVIKPDVKSLDGLVCEDYDVPKEIDEIISYEKSHLTRYMAREEKMIPGSKYLFAGSCDICKHCAREEGKPCRFPDKMHYAIESLGIDLTKISEDIFNIKMEWMKGSRFPDHLTLICALLIR